MNSNQRRKLKREFPCSIRIECGEDTMYYWHDQKVTQAKRWCRQNLSDRWITDSDYYSTTFKFHNEKDALMFALRWA
jgi:hypothetical protein